MEQIIPWIPVISGIVTALVGVLAGYITASWKIREIKLTYEQKRRDSYLENARRVSDKVYIPLAVAISKLSRAYTEFIVNTDFDNLVSVEFEAAAVQFKKECEDFENIVYDLLQRGASAYLTLALENELNSFSLFIKSSMDATNVIQKTVLSPILLNKSFPIVQYRSDHKSLQSIAKYLKIVLSVVPLGPFSLEIESKILAAPFSSRAFEDRFQSGVLLIGALIKEVTLGSRSAPEI